MPLCIRGIEEKKRAQIAHIHSVRFVNKKYRQTGRSPSTSEEDCTHLEYLDERNSHKMGKNWELGMQEKNRISAKPKKKGLDRGEECIEDEPYIQ